jgi:hypothetical protein
LEKERANHGLKEEALNGLMIDARLSKAENAQRM